MATRGFSFFIFLIISDIISWLNPKSSPDCKTIVFTPYLIICFAKLIIFFWGGVSCSEKHFYSLVAVHNISNYGNSNYKIRLFLWCELHHCRIFYRYYSLLWKSPWNHLSSIPQSLLYSYRDFTWFKISRVGWTLFSVKKWSPGAPPLRSSLHCSTANSIPAL